MKQKMTLVPNYKQKMTLVPNYKQKIDALNITKLSTYLPLSAILSFLTLRFKTKQIISQNEIDTKNVNPLHLDTCG